MYSMKICKNCVHFAQTDRDEGQCYRPSTLYSMFYGVANVLCCDCCDNFEQIKRRIRTTGAKSNGR